MDRRGPAASKPPRRVFSFCGQTSRPVRIRLSGGCATRFILLLLAFTAFAQQPPKRILIAYHSQTGNTEKVAQAIRSGAAKVEGIEAVLRKTADVKPEEIAGYNAILLGTPVHWSNMTTETRRFLDLVGDALWKAKSTGDGKLAGAFCTGGGTSMGKEAARLSILSAFLTMRFLVIGGVDADGFGTLGPAPTTGTDDPGLSEKELEEARRYGERFARAVLQVAQGGIPAP